MAEQTLSNVRLLDLTWYIAGPYCTKMLADYGAEVIKVEKPGEGDPTRHIPPFLGDDPHPEKSLLFSHLNINKRGITLDLKSAGGRKVIKKLAKEAHILVESFSPGVRERLGLDYETLKKVNPRLVMTSISSFGQTGPYRDFKASELVLAGLGHDMYSCGIQGRHPLKLGGYCMQYQVGHMAAAATLAAYWAQQTQGIGQHIDVSAQEVLATDTDHKSANLLSFAFSGMIKTTPMCGRMDPREVASDIMPTGVFPCKDGFIRAGGIYVFWDRFVKIFPELKERFKFPEDILDLKNKPIVDALWYDWCASRTKKEIMEICQEAKHIVVAINTPKECVESEQLRERGFWVEGEYPVTGKQIYPGDPLNAESSPWEFRMPAPLLGQHNEEVLGNLGKRPRVEIVRPDVVMPERANMPLEGIRVVDLGVVWAAPTAAWLLGCLGAEVIHVDNPHHAPDLGRGFTLWPTPDQIKAPSGTSDFPEGKVGPRPWNANAFWARAFWNRLSCCIDLAKPGGKDVFKRLIAKSDIFIENNSATAMEHLGFGHDALLSVNPRLICINMPAWGRTGPYKDYVGWGAMHQALAGEEWIRGYDDEEHPFHNTFRFHMDSASPPMAVLGAIMGLMQREKTGRGQWIDFAQIQAMIPHFGEIYMDAAWNGTDQRTLGNRHPTAVQGTYPCRGPKPTLDTAIHGGERWLNITIHDDKEWKGFCDALRNTDWTRDEKFSTAESRRKHHDELDEHISAWTRHRDNFEAFYILQAYGVPAGPVEDHRDAHMDPQLNARNFFLTISQKDIGTYRYPGFPWKFSETSFRVTHPPALVGEDNEYVYKEVIGMSDDEVADLIKKDIIGNLEYILAGPIPSHIAENL